MGFGVADQLISNLLDSVESVSAESDAGAFDLLVLDSLLFSVLISHRVYSLIFMNNQFNKILNILYLFRKFYSSNMVL